MKEGLSEQQNNSAEKYKAEMDISPAALSVEEEQKINQENDFFEHMIEDIARKGSHEHEDYDVETQEHIKRVPDNVIFVPDDQAGELEMILLENHLIHIPWGDGHSAHDHLPPEERAFAIMSKEGDPAPPEDIVKILELLSSEKVEAHDKHIAEA